jgi:hypothetical protein
VLTYKPVGRLYSTQAVKKTTQGTRNKEQGTSNWQQGVWPEAGGEINMIRISAFIVVGAIALLAAATPTQPVHQMNWWSLTLRRRSITPSMFSIYG